MSYPQSLRNVRNIDEFLPGAARLAEQEADSEGSPSDEVDMDFDLDNEPADDTDITTGEEDPFIDTHETPEAPLSTDVAAPIVSPTPMAPVTQIAPIAPVTSDYHAKPLMSLQNLKKIQAQTIEMISMMENMPELERWAEDHITTSAADLDEVYSFLKYGRQ